MRRWNPDRSMNGKYRYLSVLIDNWPCSINTYRYFIISILPITRQVDLDMVIFSTLSAFRKLFIPLENTCMRSRILNIGLLQQLIALSCIFFKVNKKFHIDLLLMFFITRCYWHENKIPSFLIFIEKILLKR